jgi:hypothetical protein
MVQKSIRSEGGSSEEQLAESLMPGWTAIKNPRAAPIGGVAGLQDSLRKAGVDIVTMPSLDELKAKYAGFTGPLRDSGAGSSGLADNPDTAIVNLQNGPLRKTVAFSKSAKKVLWSQG